MISESQSLLVSLNERGMSVQTLAALLNIDPSLVRFALQGEKPLTSSLPLLRILHAEIQESSRTQAPELDVQDVLEAVRTLVDQEEAAFPLTSFSTFQASQMRRTALRQGFTAVFEYVKELRQRIQQLPSVPEVSLVRWAQAVLTFPNLALLAVDTTGLGDDADLIRIVLLDGQDQVLFDQIIQPQRQRLQANTPYTGIVKDDLVAAPTLVDVWPRVLAALAGRYVFVYNQEFLLPRLQENARAYHLEEPVMIVEDVMLKAQEYFGETRHPKLADVCRWIGEPFVSPATALDRAHGQLHVLQAMSEAKTNVLNTSQSDDKHPF